MKSILIVCCIAVFSFSELAISRGSWEPIPDLKKSELMQEFVNFDSQQRTQLETFNTEQSEPRYDIRVYYVNDKELEMNYYTSVSYPNLPDDKQKYPDISKEKLDQFKKEIYDHFLGTGYEDFNPILVIANKQRVGIQLTISPNGLAQYVTDSRIVSINNMIVELENTREWNSQLDDLKKAP